MRTVLLYAALYGVAISSVDAVTISAVSQIDGVGYAPRCQTNILRNGSSLKGYPREGNTTVDGIGRKCRDIGNEIIGRFSIEIETIADTFVNVCSANLKIKVGDTVLAEDSYSDQSYNGYSTCAGEVSVSLNTDTYACMMFEHADYKGKMHYLSNGQTESKLTKLNDEISSVMVAGGCQLRLYEHADFSNNLRGLTAKGVDRPYVSRVANLGSENDMATSARCTCR